MVAITYRKYTQESRKKMKAWVLHRAGNIRYEEVRKPEPGEGEVLVAVKAAGICGSDIPRIYQNGAHRMPLIPGHEFSGKVAELGKGAGQEWLHKRVGVFPLIPCRECIACRKGQYEMCRSYSYLGSRRDGGFAEYVAVPADNLIELPDEVSYEEAAMLEPMAVAVHAMRRVEIRQPDTVVVCGLGTIGMLLVMFLLNRGIRDVLVIGNKEFQKRMAVETGVPEENFCDSRKEDVKGWLDTHTDGAGADVFFECVGKNETFSQAVGLAAPGGRICLVGNPYSDMKLDREIYWKILRNQLTVTGTWNSSFTGQQEDDWHEVLSVLEQQGIAPAGMISHRFPLSKLEQGLHIMRNKSEDYIKIMVKQEIPGFFLHAD